MQDLPEGVTHWEGPSLEAWDGAWSPLEIAEKLAGVGVPWCVVGGWAIDLFLGEVTRRHHDLEIAICRRDFLSVRTHLRAYRFFVVGDGEVRELRSGVEPPETKHQNWLMDPEANVWRVDVMLEPGDAETWVFRRDGSVTAPRSEMIAQRDGVPYLKPQGALLYKARWMLPKDEADFENCLPRMNAGERSWLASSIARAHPGHEWLPRLT